MASIEEKLLVLSKIGKELNDSGSVWAVGASLLLYFKGKTKEFNDIDIMTTEEDIKRVKEILTKHGTLSQEKPNPAFKSKHFLEFTVDGVDIDIIAGFVIISCGICHDFPLLPQSIMDFTRVNGVKIPLQSLSDWREYYRLMGRDAKVAMIDG